MKTYKETKSEIKKLVLRVGVSGIYGYHINALVACGHNSTNIQNAMYYITNFRRCQMVSSGGKL